MRKIYFYRVDKSDVRAEDLKGEFLGCYECPDTQDWYIQFLWDHVADIIWVDSNNSNKDIKLTDKADNINKDLTLSEMLSAPFMHVGTIKMWVFRELLDLLGTDNYVHRCFRCNPWPEYPTDKAEREHLKQKLISAGLQAKDYLYNMLNKPGTVAGLWKEDYDAGYIVLQEEA